ncbi:hypothetical protein [Terricaulis sp.]|uniref:hypothetical protein n=1 Tax=Terricaulis sp. TaxID=2768686 RepID=UPI003784078C
MIRRSIVLALAVALCCCGQPARESRVESVSGAIVVNQSQEEVAQYLRVLSEREPVAEGVRQRLRADSDEAIVVADLIDTGSGNIVGLVTYTLTPEGEQTRIGFALSQMTGLYADARRQQILTSRIVSLLARDLGDT